MSLILTTFGGDAHAAYRLTRILKATYETFRILIVGPCKSAGTLVALGADEIAFGPFGELGPLDVQLRKKDELVSLSSGLDTLQTFGLITGYAFSTFESFMLQTVLKSGGVISTKTACQVASDLAIGLFSPLMEQINPQQLSEVDRVMAIARAYGQRIKSPNLQDGALEKLVSGYPSHSFIIDEEEASSLFTELSDIRQQELAGYLLVERLTKGRASVPKDDILAVDVWSAIEDFESERGSDDKPRDQRHADSPESAEGRRSRKPGTVATSSGKSTGDANSKPSQRRKSKAK